MTTAEICRYIEILDYIDYRKFLNETFGDKSKRLMLSKYRYRRHIIMDMAIDMIMSGNY